MAAPNVSVIIPCFNRAETLERVLAAYEQQDADLEFELIAVDDGSTDATHEVLARRSYGRFQLKTLRQENGGPARARNRGLELAAGALVLFTGDDVIPEPDLLQCHLNAHHALDDPKVAVLGRTDAHGVPETTVMRHINGLGAQQFSYHYLRPRSFVDFRHFYTSNVSLPRALLVQERQRFSTSFHWAAWEDVELGWRLERRGMRIYYEPGALAHHHHLYSARTFAERQYKSGRMAAFVLEVRPELAAWTNVSELSRSRRRKRHRSRELRSVLERGVVQTEEALLRLLTPYENLPVDPLDRLYLAAFHYFYLKGLAEGLYGKRGGRVLRAELLADEVIPAVYAFITACDAVAVPVPEGERMFFQMGVLRSITEILTPKISLRAPTLACFW